MVSYEDIDALNWSAGKYILTSPKLYRHRTRHPESPKPAYVWGGALHTGVLEPGKFDSRYAVYDDRRAGKAWEAWQAEHPGVVTLKSHELADVLGAIAAIRDDADAQELLRGGRVEEPITWIDPDTGLKCKGRVDCFRPDRVVDLKSTTDVGELKFGAACARLLYHAQLAWYHYGAIFAKRLAPDAKPPAAIAVEKEAPWDVACYEMTRDQLDAGRGVGLTMQRQLMACIETDYWPGKVVGLTTLRLPHWAPGMSEEAFA